MDDDKMKMCKIFPKDLIDIDKSKTYDPDKTYVFAVTHQIEQYKETRYLYLKYIIASEMCIPNEHTTYLWDFHYTQNNNGYHYSLFQNDIKKIKILVSLPIKN